MSPLYCEGTENYHSMKVLMESAEATVEICEQCKEKFTFKKSRHGRIDNEYYHDIHYKDFLQPGMKNYEKEYQK